MIEEEFYATLKLKYTGEEVFARVAASEEEDRTIWLFIIPLQFLRLNKKEE